MKQVVQSLKTGNTNIFEIPAPRVQAGHLLISTRSSVISAGTERTLVEFGSSNLLQKAISQPDRVQQVIDKIRTDGLLTTVDAVFSKLDEPLAMGYSNVGIVLEVGVGVRGFEVGDRVASNGPHAEIVLVPQHLCARIPEAVNDETAVFTVMSSIALQGVRLASPTIGETVAVIGLGLIGLLTVQILVAHGCRVLGIDYDPHKLKLAHQYGAEVVNLSAGLDPIAAGLKYSRGEGVDAVILTASTKSNDPIHQAAQMSRKRGRIILVGVVGLDLKRADFYEKELTFQVSCSYGPGRYDSSYELGGHDYPLGFVRWTEQRNFEAVLELMASKKIDVSNMISARYAHGNAEAAYQLLAKDKSVIGIILSYLAPPPSQQRLVKLHEISTKAENKVICGIIGAGNFATRTLLPELVKTSVALKSIISSKGMSARYAANRFNIAEVGTDYCSVLEDQKINTVFILTRHDTHVKLVIDALRSEKHVFVEKPLALNRGELAELERVRKEYPNGQLLVGYNRRFAPLSVKLRDQLANRLNPCSLIYTVNAGAIAADHWTQDPIAGGGRIIGEACHFIDLMLFLVGSPIVGVDARMIGGGPAIPVRTDKMTIQIAFADGSTGVVHYLANGSNEYPKERLEVFSDGRIAVLNNFRSLYGYGWKGLRVVRSRKQDKGHYAEIMAFLDRVQTGGKPLISWEDLRDVTLASFIAVERASEIRPTLTNDKYFTPSDVDRQDLA